MKFNLKMFLFTSIIISFSQAHSETNKKNTVYKCEIADNEFGATGTMSLKVDASNVGTLYANELVFAKK